MCVSSALQAKISPSDWYMRKQGWAGSVNPAAELNRAIERKTPGLQSIAGRRTETEKLEESMNRSPSRQKELMQQRTGASAHAINISRAQSGVSRPTVAPIAGRSAG